MFQLVLWNWDLRSLDRPITTEMLLSQHKFVQFKISTRGVSSCFSTSVRRKSTYLLWASGLSWDRPMVQQWCAQLSTEGCSKLLSGRKLSLIFSHSFTHGLCRCRSRSISEQDGGVSYFRLFGNLFHTNHRPNQNKNINIFYVAAFKSFLTIFSFPLIVCTFSFLLAPKVIFVTAGTTSSAVM